MTVTDDSGAANGSDTETVTITMTGTNDDPDIRVSAGDSASASLPETNAGLSTNGTLTVTDVDTSDTISTSISLTSVTGNAGGLTNPQLLAMLSATPNSGLPADAGNTNNLTWNFNSGSQAFNYLTPGQSLQLTYTLTVSDGHGGTDAQDVTVTITGTNDAPLLTGDLAAPINEGGSYQLTTADLNFTDPDDAAADVTFTATGLSNGTLFVNGVPQNSFTGAQLAAGLVTFTHNGSETLTAGFSISVEDGNEDVSTPVAQPFNFTVAPVNDAPVAVADTANTAEDSSILINVLTNDSDPDGDTLSLTAANVTTGLGTATVESGQVRYDPGTAYNSLAVGETANVVVSYSISDGHGGTATSTATVTVTGTNDVPDIRVQAGDSSSVTIAETNAGLTASDTFTVTDADTSDTVSTGVALTTVSGNQGSLTNAQLLAMLSVVPTSGLPANSGSANNLTWTFNSGTEAFNYLLVGQSLNLTYTLTVSDGHGGTDTQTLTVAVTGTADGITLAPVYTGDDDPTILTVRTLKQRDPT